MAIHDDLAQRVLAAAEGRAEYQMVSPFTYRTDRQNQFICFLKPEVFLIPQSENRRALVHLVFDQCQKFDVELDGCVILSGGYLDRSAAMDRHYGFINQMSRRASQMIREEDAARLRIAVNAPPIARVLGGHEYMAESGLDATALDSEWQRNASIKIRSGLYIQLFDATDGPIVLVNGFHPAQLRHFTAPERRIAVMVLNSDLPWSFLRTFLIGDTFPGRAMQGSIRRRLHDNAATYGLGTVDITNNCVHLSAGPFEAFFELANFLAGIPEAHFDPSSTSVGQILTSANMGEHFERIQSNPKSSQGALFDLTEGIDVRSGVALYGHLFAADRAA